MSNFYHFPEIHLNINLIIISISKNIKQNQQALLLFTADKLDFSSLKDNFQIFRGKFNGISKLINISHLNILKNFIINSNNNIQLEVLGKLVVYCFRSFFKTTSKFVNRYLNFSRKKQVDIEIQDLITFIAFNLTKNKDCISLLFESDFFNDLIEYIILITEYDEDNESWVFIKNIETKKKLPFSKEKKVILERIIKQTVGIILNVYKTNNESIIRSFDKIVSNIYYHMYIYKLQICYICY